MKTWIVDCETELIRGADSKLRTEFHTPELVAVGVLEACADQVKIVTYDQDPKVLGWNWETDHFVFHNPSFDLRVLCQCWPELSCPMRDAVLRGQVTDTMVLYRQAYPSWDRPASLAAVFEHLFGTVLEKGEVRTSFRRGEPLTPAQREYLEADVRATRRVWSALIQTPSGGLLPRNREYWVQARSITTAPEIDAAYHKASALKAWFLEPCGLRLDRHTLAQLHTDYTQTVQRLLFELVEYGLARVKKVPKAAVESVGYLQLPDVGWHLLGANGAIQRTRKGKTERSRGVITLDEKALSVAYADFAASAKIETETTPTGALSLRYDFWKQFKDQLPPGLRVHIELGKSRKYLTSYLDRPFRSGASKVYPHYAIPGAETGRWACWGPALQQVPKTLRPIYYAGSRHTLIGADYKSLELYTLAQTMYCHGIDGPLRAALNAGGDIHARTAELMGRPGDRQSAKAGNFGIPGGMGAKKFWLYCCRKLGMRISFEEAAAIRNAWFAAYPDVKAYLDMFRVDPYTLKHDWQSRADFLHELGFDLDREWPTRYDVSKRIENGEFYTVTLPSGRTIPRRRFSSAANIGFQGPGADMITVAFVNCCRAGLRPVAVVHDSIVIETICVFESMTATALALAHEHANQLASAMHLAHECVCPDLVAPPITPWIGTHLQ